MKLRWPEDTRRLQLAGLIVLTVVTLVVVAATALKYQAPAQRAMPARTTSASPTQTPTVEPPASPTPSPEAEPATQAPLSPLQQVGTSIATPGSSVMVIGDGTGNEDDEWVAVWAREHLAAERGVAYHLWDRYGVRWLEPVTMGAQPATIDVWNASTISPDMPGEAARVQAAWQPVDAVFLSYGHWRDPTVVGSELTVILNEIRGHDPNVPVVVILQNPGPSSVAGLQEAAVNAVADWARQNNLPTLDVYSGFPTDQAARDALVEEDGSPNVEGSRLFARIVADALRPA